MGHNDEVRDFLRSRRSRITPEEAGLPRDARRRVAGLRREEVADLAGVSIDYYARLERGNLTGVSDPVITAVSRALRLDQAEHDHLTALAALANDPSRTAAARPADTVRPELHTMLNAIVEAPALIRNRRMDLVAANALGWALHDTMRGAPAHNNFARFIFCDPTARDFYADWSLHADTTVALLRRDSARSPHEPGIVTLAAELSAVSDEFASRWNSHDVRRHYSGSKQYRHPVAGFLDLTYQTLEFEDDPGLVLTILTAEPGSVGAERLRLLRSWNETAPNDHSELRRAPTPT
ncbi:MAG: helix-turn-helix transcriptional regulator [Mycetocola sp.]